MLRKTVAGSLIACAAAFGLAVGAGSANAKIEPGHYKLHYSLFGVKYTPDANVTVIGNRMYNDAYGAGPWNLEKRIIQPTRNGGVVAKDPRPATRFVQHDEYTQRTRDGYRGTTYAYGLPAGDVVLKKVNPRR